MEGPLEDLGQNAQDLPAWVAKEWSAKAGQINSVQCPASITLVISFRTTSAIWVGGNLRLPLSGALE
jgi:hypothetical protein